VPLQPSSQNTLLIIRPPSAPSLHCRISFALKVTKPLLTFTQHAFHRFHLFHTKQGGHRNTFTYHHSAARSSPSGEGDPAAQASWCDKSYVPPSDPARSFEISGGWIRQYSPFSFCEKIFHLSVSAPAIPLDDSWLARRDDVLTTISLSQPHRSRPNNRPIPPQRRGRSRPKGITSEEVRQSKVSTGFRLPSLSRRLAN